MSRHITVIKEDVRDRDIRFWHGPSRYTLDLLRKWQAKNGNPWHKADEAWHLRIIEDGELTHDGYYETRADAYADGNYILANPRSIEGPDRAWELDYMANANKV